MEFIMLGVHLAHTNVRDDLFFAVGTNRLQSQENNKSYYYILYYVLLSIQYETGSSVVCSVKIVFIR